MAFWDQDGNELISFRGETIKGKTYTIELNKNEHINGIEANMCPKYVRGIGFFIWTLGLGVPIKEEGEEEQKVTQ